MDCALIVPSDFLSLCKKYFALAALLFLFSEHILAQAPDSWTQMSDMPAGAAARDRASSFTINGIGYIGLGSNGGNTYYNSLWAYNPLTDTWTQKADLTLANASRCRSFSFSLNGKGYVGTGWDGAYLQGVFEYDPGTNSWVAKNVFGGGGCFGTACFTAGNKVYVTGGYDGTILNQHWEYDPAADVWTQKAGIPVARYSATAFAIGKIGYVGTGYGSNYLSDFWKYNPLTNTWKQVSDIPGGARALATAFSLGPRGFVLGGSDNGTVPKSDVWEYNPFIDSWIQKANFGGGVRFAASAFVIGGHAFVGTGNSNASSVPGTPQKDLWKYTPSPLSNNKFQKTYGGTNSDTDTSGIAYACPTPDGGYIISSTTRSYGQGGDDVYVLKTGPAGVVQWGKTYGSAGNEAAASVRPTGDGGYIVAGSTRNTSTDDDMLVLKISSAGNLQWNRSLAGTQSTRANYAEETNAGGEFLIAGKGGLPGWNNTALVKLSATGTPVLARNISVSSSIDEGFFLTQTTSGNYLVSGNMMSGSTDIDAYLVALTNTGNIIPGTHVRFDSPGLNGADMRSLVRQTDDGGFIICGSSNAPGFTNGLFDFFLIKVQNNLVVSWARSYGGAQDDFARSIAITNEGDFAVAGFTRSYGTGTDAFLSLIDPNGTPVWTKTYGGSLVDRANSVYQTADGGFLLCGETFSLGNVTTSTGSDIYLIKTDSIGNSGCNESSVVQTPVLSMVFSQIPVSGTPQAMTTGSIAIGQTTASGAANHLCAQCTFPFVKSKADLKCFGASTGVASAVPVGGVNPYTYVWSTGATTSSVSGLAAGTYSVLVVDANQCSAFDTINITQPPALAITLSSDSVDICQGGSSSLGANASGGSPPLTYVWSPASGLSCTSCQTPVATPSGNTIYIVTVTDSKLCTKNDSVHVIIHSAPVAVAGPDQSVCGGFPVSIGGSPVVGENYSWSPATGLNNATISNPSAGPSVSTAYVVTVKDAYGCSDVDTVQLTVVSAPVVTVATTYSTICTGINNTTLTASSAGATGYIWSPGGQTNDTIVVSPQSTTTYTVEVSGAGSCKGTNTITISVLTNPYQQPVISPATNAYCQGENILPITVTNSNGIVVWLNITGGVISTGATYQPTGAFSGYVAQGGLGCFSNPTLVTVTMNPLPTANAGSDITICPGHTAQLQASGGINYLWSPDTALSAANISGPSASPDSTFSYQVEVTDANGCRDKDSVTVFIFASDSCGIHIYNVITPNSDGLNEGWWIDGIAAYPENTVTIFNRWGTKVWGRQNYDNKQVIWKGRNDDGDPLPAGTYYYVINIKDKTYSKWVELLR